MKKYLLSLIFSLCLLFSLVPQNVQAAGMDAESQTPD